MRCQVHVLRRGVREACWLARGAADAYPEPACGSGGGRSMQPAGRIVVCVCRNGTHQPACCLAPGGGSHDSMQVRKVISWSALIEISSCTPLAPLPCQQRCWQLSAHCWRALQPASFARAAATSPSLSARQDIHKLRQLLGRAVRASLVNCASSVRKSLP